MCVKIRRFWQESEGRGLIGEGMGEGTADPRGVSYRELKIGVGSEMRLWLVCLHVKARAGRRVGRVKWFPRLTSN
jgi:hypothetical protein